MFWEHGGKKGHMGGTLVNKVLIKKNQHKRKLLFVKDRSIVYVNSVKQEFELLIKSLKNMAITKIPLVGSHR